MEHPFWIVDAFASRPFEGNPAAVCLCEALLDEVWMQHIAAEFNLSETAFLAPRGNDEWDLRWFTPTLEVDLCGHATLASAFTLLDSGRLENGSPARFHTRSGILTAWANPNEVTLDFPSEPPEPAQVDGLEEALGERALWIGRNRMDLFAELASESSVRLLRPDFEALGAMDARGVIVTARSNDGAYQVVSRFFAPACGVPEDPVTGSAHCALAPYWSGKLGAKQLHAYQASKRGGMVRMTHQGDRVLLGGSVQLISSGVLHA